MLSARITVTLSGTLGLDDGDDLLAELRKQTDLDWHIETRADDKHLTGAEPVLFFIAYKLIDKIIDKIADKDADLLVNQADQAVAQLKAQVKKAIDRFTANRMDPPDISTEVTTNDDRLAPSADAGSSDDAVQGG